MVQNREVTEGEDDDPEAYSECVHHVAENAREMERAPDEYARLRGVIEMVSWPYAAS